MPGVAFGAHARPATALANRKVVADNRDAWYVFSASTAPS